jgi:predicted GTPase
MHLLPTLRVTRDRKYGDAVYQNKSFIVVDTGGIGESEGGLMLTWRNSQKLPSTKLILLFCGGRSCRLTCFR